MYKSTKEKRGVSKQKLHRKVTIISATVLQWGKIFSGGGFLLCNQRNSFLSFGGPQVYNLEALPFTYDKYVVIELADKLYNSITFCFCLSP